MKQSVITNSWLKDDEIGAFMQEIELSFPSADAVSDIRALIWEPDDVSTTPASGIIQILHGMAEHIERYRGFAEFCTSNGYIVCGHDHVGHGKSVDDPDQWGIMPSDSAGVLVEDAQSFRVLMQKRYPTSESDDALPYIPFGHSMGSFVLRMYLTKYAKGLSGAVICGTGHPPAMLSAAGSLIAKFLSATKGDAHRSPFLHNLTVGAYSKQIENARTPVDWLSTDDSIVDEYIAAADCGYMFGTGSNATLTELTKNVVKRETVAAVPADLPLLFIAGGNDPVGEKGKAVQAAVDLFKETGHTNVTLKLYDGMRHEILNEVDKDAVYQDVIQWIGKLT